MFSRQQNSYIELHSDSRRKTDLAGAIVGQMDQPILRADLAI